MVNVAIQAIEQMYIERCRGMELDDLEKLALDTVSKAFIEQEGHVMHVLYFGNDDTVEYQRMAVLDRRVGRYLDKSKWQWLDIDDKATNAHIAESYMAHMTDHTNRIQSLWAEKGYYVVRYYLPPCYRLVQYRTLEDLTKHTRAHHVDRRKLTRGEKWEYFKKCTLITLYTKFVRLSERDAKLLSLRTPVSGIFSLILQQMVRHEMLLDMPI
jgi:hypothetical protein